MIYDNGENAVAKVLDILSLAAAGWLMLRLFVCELLKRNKSNVKFVLLDILTILYVVIGVNLIFNIVGFYDCGTTIFSVTLTVVATVELILGLKMKVKTIRMVALAAIGVVLAKLVVYDIWHMEPLSRIITFILLGVALLVASFVYHRCLPLLFDDDEDRN